MKCLLLITYFVNINYLQKNASYILVRLAVWKIQWAATKHTSANKTVSYLVLTHEVRVILVMLQGVIEREPLRSLLVHRVLLLRGNKAEGQEFDNLTPQCVNMDWKRQKTCCVRAGKSRNAALSWKNSGNTAESPLTCGALWGVLQGFMVFLL